VFAEQLAKFLEETKFPDGLSEGDLKFQTTLAVLVLTERASARLPGGFRILDIAAQGFHGGGPGPHLVETLKRFGINL
jgi:hypothetical protein